VAHGAEHSVYFAQEHPPARLGPSGLTVCDELGVQIDGAAFSHRLCGNSRCRTRT
jgi:hypothetical protein